MPKIVTVSSAVFLAILMTFGAVDSFPQKRYPGKNSAPDKKPVTRQEADNFAKHYWDRKIAHCGDSRYFFRRDGSAGLTLYEVKDVTIDSASFSAEELGAGDIRESKYSGRLLWSGSSTARFGSYRKMGKSDRTWGPWLGSGSDMTYYQLYENIWTYSPAKPFYASCSEVDLFTLKTSMLSPLPDSITQAQLNNVDGGSFTLEDYKGKVVLINLWATWCGPCRTQTPELVELQKKYQDKDFTVIGLNTDSEDQKLTLPYRERMEINYPLVTTEQQVITEFINITQMNGIPQSFLIGKDGRLIMVLKGYAPDRTKFLLDRALEIILTY